ncbi:MBL-fold metallo-hydrolase superfamily [hydrothermal vent metagenome]|uniref:MBL-fold metallo-hydrolase superfamily n=1 Tax=hydrothermal vent metagenome TaxID=652676 RepID=A0A3B0WB22_9ZZZZ
MTKRKRRVFVSTAFIFALQVTYVSASELATQDPYIEGFKAYAEEVKSYSNDLNHSLLSYVDEVKKAEKQVGYIGKALPIPKATKVTDGVYTVVGSMIWHNPSNFGLNNNLSFIIFEDGVFVFNAGANAALAYSLHQQIKALTDKPVKWVAVENNQGHAYLGASYWVDVGVKNLYSSQAANDQFDAGFERTKREWSERVGKNITLSARNVSDQFTTFEDKMVIEVGGGQGELSLLKRGYSGVEKVYLYDFGPGHTPASTSLYIPSRKVFFTGDLGFNERMPVFFKYTNVKAWIESYEAMMSTIPEDTIMVPGHGTPTNMATLKKQTYDYLVYLYQNIEKIVEADGSLEDALSLDQSMYQDRPVFRQAAENNARHVYNEISGGGF